MKRLRRLRLLAEKYINNKIICKYECIFLSLGHVEGLGSQTQALRSAHFSLRYQKMAGCWRLLTPFEVYEIATLI